MVGGDRCGGAGGAGGAEPSVVKIGLRERGASAKRCSVIRRECVRWLVRTCFWSLWREIRVEGSRDDCCFVEPPVTYIKTKPASSKTWWLVFRGDFLLRWQLFAVHRLPAR